MRKLSIILTLIGLFFVLSSSIHAQGCDIMYFCVKFDGKEIDCSDRFTTGKLTVMIRLEKEIYLGKIFIQLDKYNPGHGAFEYDKDYQFTVDNKLSNIYFNDIEFTDKGIFRVYLLDQDKNTITSALVEII